ncbi:MAG: hypothetical protein U0271_38900 [Polyangiaceae bacterium]
MADGKPTNHDKYICTDQSKHIVQNQTSEDVFVTDQASVPPTVPVTNWTRTEMLGEGKTERTLASGAHIWTSKGLLNGATDGVHSTYLETEIQEHLVKGAKSQAPPYNYAEYRAPASLDLKIEGGFVLRTDDYSWQDKKNSFGVVVESQMQSAVLVDQSAILNACTLTRLDAWQVQREEGGDRKFGNEPGEGGDKDGLYLEVLEGASIQFTHQRLDTTTGEQPGSKPPICLKPSDAKKKHTTWQVVYEGFAKANEELYDTNDAGLSFSGSDIPNPCPDAMTMLNEAIQDVTGFKKEAKLSFDSSVEAYDPAAKRYKDTIEKAERNKKTKVTEGFDFDSREEDDAVTVEDKANAESLKKDAAMADARQEALKTLGTLLQLWNFKSKAPHINVSAEACAGKKTAKIMVYPKDPFEIDIFKAFGPALQSALTFLEGAKMVSTSISKIVGRVVTNQVSMAWLEKPSCKLSFQYQELTTDGESWGRKYYAVQVGRAYKLTFGFDPLLKIQWEVKASLFDIFGFFGRVVRWGAAAIDVSAALRLELMLDIGIFVNLSCKPTGEFDAPDFKLSIKPHFVVGLEINVAKAAKATVEAEFQGEVLVHKFRGNTCNEPSCAFEFTISGSTSMMIKGGVTFDLGGLAEIVEEHDKEPAPADAPSEDSHHKTARNDSELSFEFEYPIDAFTFPPKDDPNAGDVPVHLDWFT